ncbi:MAG TPA: hypothetical protein VNN18_03240 [Candidatus Xenobia bacterium]|nr:hypothetical protein [Candidatus Xenobia bacterium]
MKRALLAVTAVVLLAAAARAAELRSDVLFLVPRESGEVAFLDLQSLRGSPHYAGMKQRFLPARFLHFERFLRSMGVDADKDIDWLAWSIVPPGPDQPQEIFLGFAQGRFAPEKIEEHFQKQRLPMDAYRGLTLFPFGSGVSAQDLLFTFIDPSTLAFGTRASLELMLETRYGSHGNLGENKALFDRVYEVNGHAPVWAVFDEKYTRLAVRQLLPEAAKFPEFAEAAKRFRGGLLRVDVNREANVSFQAWCAQPADAQSFSMLLQVGLMAQSWKVQESDPVLSAVLQRAAVRTAGDRLELEVSIAENDLKALLERRSLL